MCYYIKTEEKNQSNSPYQSSQIEAGTLEQTSSKPMKTQRNRQNSPEDQGYPNYIVDDLYNQLEVDKDDYEFERIVDHYFKDRILFLKARYVGDTIGEDNITEVWF